MAEPKPAPVSEGISLSRWSRLKRAAAEQQATSVNPPTAAAAGDKPVALSESGERPAHLAPSDTLASSAEHTELPAFSTISLAEDFTPFMQAKVPQALRQQALKALFKEPHFNVMDGLDTYIDDYTVFEPISPEVMATLSSWKTIMNPPQQVVTSGGYAVDVESEEGKAVLAARAEAARLNATAVLDAEDLSTDAASDGGPDAVAATNGPDSADQSSLPDETAATQVTPHPRHGKRVGDFSAANAATPPSLDGISPSEHVADHSAATKSTAQ